MVIPCIGYKIIISHLFHRVVKRGVLYRTNPQNIAEEFHLSSSFRILDPVPLALYAVTSLGATIDLAVLTLGTSLHKWFPICQSRTPGEGGGRGGRCLQLIGWETGVVTKDWWVREGCYWGYNPTGNLILWGCIAFSPSTPRLSILQEIAIPQLRRAGEYILYSWLCYSDQ